MTEQRRARLKLVETPPTVQPTMLYVIKQVELVVRSRLEEVLRGSGLSALQYTALTVLERHPDLTCAQLARNSFVKDQTMADMLTVLERQDMIERHRDPSDGRRMLVRLTTKSRRLLARYDPRVAELESEMLGGLAPEQADELRRSLLACRAGLSGHPLH